MNEQFARVVVGFALQSALTSDCSTEALLNLYSQPMVESVRATYDKLIESSRHCDREVAIWLEPVLGLGALTADPKALESEMKKMELLLFFLINRAGSSSREVNDWMNYIANAAESLAGGFWIDAKILLSQALGISQSESIENLKSDPSFVREISILQSATASYFREIRTYPPKLNIPEARLHLILQTQEIMLDLMQIQDRKKPEGDDKVILGAVRGLNRATRFLMDEGKTLDLARREVELASTHIDSEMKDIAREEKRRRVHECNSRMKVFLRNWAL